MAGIRGSLALCMLATVSLGADALPRGDGGVFRGGPERTGDFSDATLPARPAVLWTTESAEGFGVPVVANGFVFVTEGDSLLALRAATGEVVWREQVPGRDAGEPPAVVGELVYLSTDLGLSAFSRGAGALLWHTPVRAGLIESSPLPAGGRLIVAGYDGHVRAFDPKNGDELWSLDIAEDAPASPPGFDQKRAVIGENAARPRTAAADGETAFVPVFDQSRVVAVDLKTGKRRWSYQTGGWVYGEPTVAGDSVYVTSQDKKLYKLDKTTGEVRWSFATKWRIESGVGVRDGGVFFGSCDGFFYRVDAETGKSVWSFETPRRSDGKHEPIYSSPIVTKDLVCFGSFDGHLYALKTTRGDLAWKVRPVEGAEVSSSPCTDGSRVFFTVRRNFEKRGAYALVAVGEAKPE